MRIVLAIDGSECSETALKSAQKLYCPIGTEIKVVTALDFSEPLPVVDDVKVRESIAAERLISEAVDQLRQSHPHSEVTGEVLDGYPVDAILSLSRNWIADLIVVGSHGRRGFSRYWLGSVSRAVLLHAPCAVRIVRAEQKSPVNGAGQNVLICLDESEHSRHLVDHVLAFPWKENTRFRCVHIVKALHKADLLDEDSELYPAVSDSFNKLVEGRKAEVDAVAKRINETYEQEAASAEVLLGDAREKILQLAAEWPADLIVLGSHGRRGIDRLIMGSVSESVALNAACSVEITRIPALRKHGMHIII